MNIAKPWTGVLLGLLAAPAFAADPPASKAERAASADVQSAEPAVSSPSTPAPAAAKTAGTPRKGGTALDRMDLETTQITGNRELPKVMVIVPWKRSDIGDLAGRPSNSLVDEALKPVDRDVFRREVAYYDAVSAGRGRTETGVTATKQDGGPEK